MYIFAPFSGGLIAGFAKRSHLNLHKRVSCELPKLRHAKTFSINEVELPNCDIQYSDQASEWLLESET